MSIIRSKKGAYDFIVSKLVLGRYTEFCRIASALSKKSAGVWILVYSRAFGVKS